MPFIEQTSNHLHTNTTSRKHNLTNCPMQDILFEVNELADSLASSSALGSLLSRGVSHQYTRGSASSSTLNAFTAPPTKANTSKSLQASVSAVREYGGSVPGRAPSGLGAAVSALAAVRATVSGVEGEDEEDEDEEGEDGVVEDGVEEGEGCGCVCSRAVGEAELHPAVGGSGGGGQPAPLEGGALAISLSGCPSRSRVLRNQTQSGDPADIPSGGLPSPSQDLKPRSYTSRLSHNGGHHQQRSHHPRHTLVHPRSSRPTHTSGVLLEETGGLTGLSRALKLIRPPGRASIDLGARYPSMPRSGSLEPHATQQQHHQQQACNGPSLPPPPPLLSHPSCSAPLVKLATTHEAQLHLGPSQPMCEGVGGTLVLDEVSAAQLVECTAAQPCLPPPSTCVTGPGTPLLGAVSEEGEAKEGAAAAGVGAARGAEPPGAAGGPPPEEPEGGGEQGEGGACQW